MTMFSISLLVLLSFLTSSVRTQTTSNTNLTAWQNYLILGNVSRPMGRTLNYSNVAHRHFAIGHLCLHSFMYDEARESFDFALAIDPRLIEAHIGKMLACKQALWSYTDFQCGLRAYNASQDIIRNASLNLTDLQSSLLNTVQLWYSNETSIKAGEIAFLASMRNLSVRYPNETDIQAFLGLSLLNVGDHHEQLNVSQSTLMEESRTVLQAAHNREPHHPGILHYLIHAYDVILVDVANMASGYASSYSAIVRTASHAQHMPSHIWIRIGAWKKTVDGDRSALITSLSLCAIKILNVTEGVNSTELDPVLNRAKAMNKTIEFLNCDKENRAHSLEWLGYAHIQTGDWSNTIANSRDLFSLARYYHSNSRHYLDYAYLLQARTIIDLFFWYPYKTEFFSRTNQLLALNGTQMIMSVPDNELNWYSIWGEAGLRFSECLRLITDKNNKLNETVITEHLQRLNILENRSRTLNQYVSTSIGLISLQILGIRAYANESWQMALDCFTQAVTIENLLVADANSPTLIFARSSELLSLHLSLLYESYRLQPRQGRAINSSYVVLGGPMAISNFPNETVRLFKKANETAPHRSINYLGLAKGYTQLRMNEEAARLYRSLLGQLVNSTSGDNGFVTNVNQLLTSVTKSTGAIHHTTIFVVLLVYGLLQLF